MHFIQNHTARSRETVRAGHAESAGIEAFEIGDRSIKVRFAEGGTYLYDQVKPGKVHVAQMIALARAGAGLATYISQQVRGNHARKLD